jgi:plasmid stability protein
VRTTLTLDDDVAARLKAVTRREHRRFRAVVNEVLRAGLSALEKGARQRTPHRTAGFNLGPSLVGSLDNVEDVLARGEGENHQ